MLFLFVAVVLGVAVGDSDTKNEGVAFNFSDYHLTGSAVEIGKHTFRTDQPRGLVVRASGHKSRGSGFDSRLYHGDFPCEGRIPVVTMVWIVSIIRFKVETSLTRNHTSINKLIESTTEISSLEGTSPRETASTSAHRVPKYSDS